MKLVATFRERFNETIKERNLTARDVAYKTNITEATISRYLSGKMEPKIHYLHLIANALNVSPIWLMGYDIEKDKQSKLKEEINFLMNNLNESQLEDVAKFIKTFLLKWGDNT